jgi:hypothetical protein
LLQRAKNIFSNVARHRTAESDDDDDGGGGSNNNNNSFLIQPNAQESLVSGISSPSGDFVDNFSVLVGMYLHSSEMRVALAASWPDIRQQWFGGTNIAMNYFHF